MAAQRDFDLIVLGAGSGGIAGAIRAASHGARVALLEPAALGGTCVNIGCVPKKAMWIAADLAGAQHRAKALGFDLEPGVLDWSRFLASRRAYIERIHASYRARFEQLGITLVPHRGRFAADGSIDSEAGCLRAPHVLIATGAHPHRLSLPGCDLGMVSDDVFELDHAPKRLAIVGSGYIALEFAGVFRALGSEVELLVRGDRLAGRFDADLSKALDEAVEAQGIRVHFGTRVRAVTHGDGGYCIECESGTVHRGHDALLWGLGRDPNTRDLNLEALEIGMDAEGHVQVDRFQNTTRDGVYAVGDVTRAPELTPLAIAHARRLMDRLFGGEPEARFDDSLVPTVMFSHPPVATVGLTEADAHTRFAGEGVRVYTSRFRPMAGALAGEAGQTFMKLVCAGTDERVVGLHMLGEGVDEILQGFAVAMRMGACKRDFDATLAIHPTSAEELVLMR